MLIGDALGDRVGARVGARPQYDAVGKIGRRDRKERYWELYLCLDPYHNHVARTPGRLGTTIFLAVLLSPKD